MSQYNPYAAPQAIAPSPNAPQYGGSGPQPWEIGEVLGHAWNVFKPNWATLVFSFLLGRLIGGLPNYIPAVVVATRAVEQGSETYWVIYSICTFIGLLVGAFFQVGFVKIWLAAARGMTPEFGDLFSGGGRYFAMLGTMFLVLLAILLGYLALIVPGVILALGLSFSYFYVVDQNMGPIEAMKASWAATKGQKGKIFLFGLASALLFLAALLACCFPALVAAPVIGIAAATIYVRISGTGGGGGMTYGAPGGYAPSAGYGPPAGYGAPPPGAFGGPPQY